MRRLLPLLAVVLAAQLAACASVRRAPPAPGEDGGPALAFAPDEPTLGDVERALVGKNDEELFAIGTAAYAAGEHARAAAAFARLADVFPSSRHRPAALYAAGLAYGRQGEWRLALERFRALERDAEGADAIEAGFRIAECHYHLGHLAEAHARLAAIAARPDLPAGERVRALAQRGIVELEDGRPAEAERSLEDAVALHEEASEAERLDPEPAAQARFYLGELERERFLALPLDPASADPEALRRDLERKADVLLAAQGHYLGAIRAGSDRWAVASGYRIGELYDALRAQMLEAPLPAGLDAPHARAYRAELRRRVRVLAARAIAVYEQTLARAATAGVDDVRFLGDARASLERLERALAEEARPAER